MFFLVSTIAVIIIIIIIIGLIILLYCLKSSKPGIYSKNPIQVLRGVECFQTRWHCPCRSRIPFIPCHYMFISFIIISIIINGALERTMSYIFYLLHSHVIFQRTQVKLTCVRNVKNVRHVLSGALYELHKDFRNTT